MREAGYKLETKYYTNGERAYIIEMPVDPAPMKDE